MYFKFFISESWCKRAAIARSRFIQSFLNYSITSPTMLSTKANGHKKEVTLDFLCMYSDPVKGHFISLLVSNIIG